MHEMSIIAGILDSVIPSAQKAGAERVCDIHLSIGEMAEVVDEALNFAFEVLSEGTLCEGATLTVKKVSPCSLCFDCGHKFSHDRFHRSCPSCGSFRTKLIAGRELTIDNIEVDLPD